MIDSRAAVHKAVYAALSAAGAIAAVADVWGHPEEGTEPTEDKGLVLIGLASASNEAAKDGDLDEVTLDILTYIRKPDQTELYALSSLVRNVLEGQAVTAAGALISAPEFVSAEADLMDDGETYFDSLRFRMFVQPA